ncbi:MAG: TlpA family protein disulfide reductase [Myxococcales bacterium]|nr:TlpA family protein disulfide reductase [Myxococcales bacterium]
MSDRAPDNAGMARQGTRNGRVARHGTAVAGVGWRTRWLAVALAALATHGGLWAASAPVQAEPPSVRVELLVDAAMDLHYARRWADAAARLRQAQALLPELPAGQERTRSLTIHIAYNLGCALALGGDNTAAIAALEQALGEGFGDLDHIEGDRDLDGLRATAGYKDLLKRARLREEAALLFELDRQKMRSADALSKGALFPFDFAAPATDGRAVRLRDLRGKVVLVDLWATWCAPCRSAIPGLVRLQDMRRARGLQVVGLAAEHGSGPDVTEGLQAFAREFRINYPVAAIDSTLLEQVPNLEGLPTVLLLDRTGKVRWRSTEHTTAAGLLDLVDRLLDEGKSVGSRGAPRDK